MHQDYLKGRRYTDTILVSSTGQRFKVHGLVLRLLSPQMSALLADLPEQSYNFILFPDISSDVLKLLIHAFYTGEVILEGEATYVGVLRAKNFLSEMGLLANFQGSPLTAPPKSIIEEEEEETPSTIDLQSPSLPEDDSDNFEGSQGSKDEMNFDDIIEAVATKIEEEEKAVQSSQGGVRRSFRTRRRKELPDFELGGGSDLDSPPPIIKTEPLDESDIPESIVCDLPEIKLEILMEISSLPPPFVVPHGLGKTNA
ncbi:CLUMA_CG005563_ isoform AH [Caligus rogercresseyi]|uniref:CLUMA_CG005563_ isoform AH n=1 Tax=Caligus rogercresseyi TaxID=217165 RepID=A0A7T8JX74_CALRO|nr:CLUMA_CG005563_ isoform AH [Caligus rogercresseyi]